MLCWSFSYNTENVCKTTNLGVISVGLVQNFHHNFSFVHLPIVAELLTNSFKDLCKCAKTKTLHLTKITNKKKLNKVTSVAGIRDQTQIPGFKRVYVIKETIEELQTPQKLEMHSKLTNSKSSFLIL